MELWEMLNWLYHEIKRNNNWIESFDKDNGTIFFILPTALQGDLEVRLHETIDQPRFVESTNGLSVALLLSIARTYQRVWAKLSLKRRKDREILCKLWRRRCCPFMITQAREKYRETRLARRELEHLSLSARRRFGVFADGKESILQTLHVEQLHSCLQLCKIAWIIVQRGNCVLTYRRVYAALA